MQDYMAHMHGKVGAKSIRWYHSRMQMTKVGFLHVYSTVYRTEYDIGLEVSSCPFGEVCAVEPKNLGHVSTFVLYTGMQHLLLHLGN